MVLPNLPLEIIAEILTRLPVKTLLRFRCVSKSWLSLIDNPHFIKSHLNFSIHKCNSHRMALTSVFDLQVAIYSCLLDSAMHELSPVQATLLDSPCNGFKALVGLVGSCNGLICISILGDCMVLWNPSTKKSRKLPHPDAPPSGYVIHGFGYDELNDDYKLVQIFSDDVGRVAASGSVKAVNVFSLRTNSWRSIKVSGLFLPHCAGKFANGALHWPVEQIWSICSFDLANETFQNIDLPNSIDTDVSWDLGVLGGCLCLWCDYYENRLDIWTLENGVKESWTRLVSIPYSIDPFLSIPHSMDPEGPISPLFVWENGEILLIFGPLFVLYNKKDKTFFYPDIHMGCGSCRFDEIEACVYVESFVSPNTGGEGCS